MPIKIRAPFKLSYDGEGLIRVWGYGLSRLFSTTLRWGYNVSGHSSVLPSGCFWRWRERQGQSIVQIESVNVSKNG